MRRFGLSPRQQRLLAYAGIVLLAIALVGAGTVINQNYVNRKINKLGAQITRIQRNRPQSPSNGSQTPTGRSTPLVVVRRGKQGSPGLRGRTGAQGARGATGIAGPRGPAGPRGRPGQTVTNTQQVVRQVVQQINNTTNQQIVNQVTQQVLAQLPNTNTIVQTVLGQLPPPASVATITQQVLTQVRPQINAAVGAQVAALGVQITANVCARLPVPCG